MRARMILAVTCLCLPFAARAQTTSSHAPATSAPKADDPTVGSPEMPASMGNAANMKPDAARNGGSASRDTSQGSADKQSK